MKIKKQLPDLPTRGSIRDVLRSTSGFLLALLGLMQLLPVLLTGWSAWHHYQAVVNESEQMAQRSVAALQEHAANVLDTHSQVLLNIAAMTQDRPWQSIVNDNELQDHIENLVYHFKQVAMIGLADANGQLRISSENSQPGRSIADRDFFAAHKSGITRGIFFSEAYSSGVIGKRHFSISIARRNAAGAFDGIIYASVPVEYFTSFWKQFVPTNGYLVPMVREDGMLLTRYPQIDPVRRLDPKGPFISHIRHSPHGRYTAVSQVDGIERVNTYSQVEKHPLYISFSFEKKLIMKKWLDEMMPVFFTTLVFMLALLTLWFLVAQQSYRQRASTLKWRRTASELETEISRRESAEEALRQGQKMEALGQLAGGIAHDFNNLLAGMVGNLQLMKIHLEQGRLDAVSRSIKAAESVADTATAITKRLLTFSRREPFTPSATDVNDRLVIMQQLIARAVGPTITVQVSLTETPCKTMCDPNQLDTSLLNLAINARDAMPDGGKLQLATEVVRIDKDEKAAGSALPAGEYVLISVADTGTGMAPDVLEQAFEPFFTTKPVGQGTGLGLSMIYSFVKESKGHIQIKSIPDVGTTVRIYLPKLD